MQTGIDILTYSEHFDVVRDVACSPDGTRIASCSDDKTVKIWNALTGQTIVNYAGYGKPIKKITWAPDSRMLALGGQDGRIYIIKEM